jgi:hypothetical protein
MTRTSQKEIFIRILNAIPVDGHFHTVGEIAKLSRLNYITAKRYLEFLKIFCESDKSFKFVTGKIFAVAAEIKRKRLILKDIEKALSEDYESE